MVWHSNEFQFLYKSHRTLACNMDFVISCGKAPLKKGIECSFGRHMLDYPRQQETCKHSMCCPYDSTLWLLNCRSSDYGIHQTWSSQTIFYMPLCSKTLAEVLLIGGSTVQVHCIWSHWNFVESVTKFLMPSEIHLVYGCNCVMQSDTRAVNMRQALGKGVTSCILLCPLSGTG